MRLQTFLFACACLLLLAGKAAADQIELRLGSFEGDVALQIQREAIRDFEALHPNIKVRLENIDYGLYYDKLLATYAANAAPDVAMMGYEKFSPLAERDALMPLDDLAKNTPGFDLNAYYKPIVDAHRFGGKLYVLPRDIAPMGFVYYNKRLFKEAGIPLPDGTWTFDTQVRPELKEKDFLWVLQQLTKFDKDGKPTQIAFAPGWPDLLGQSLAFSMGGKLLDDPENPTKVLCDSPAMVAAYQLEQDLMLKKKWVPSPVYLSSVLQTNSGQLFIQQKLAMVQSGIWEVPNFRKSLVPGSKEFFDWDITLFPAYKDGKRAFPSGGSGFAIFASTAHPKEAWELVRFLSGPATMNRVAAAGLAQPAIRELAQQAPWQVDANTPLPERYPASRQLTDEATKYVQFLPTTSFLPDLSTYISPQVDKIWSGDLTAEQALKKAAQDAQARLDKLRTEEKRPPFPWGIGLAFGLALSAGLAAFVFWPTGAGKSSLREKGESRAALKFVAPWLIGFVGLTLGPMILSLLMSFSTWDIIKDAQWRGFGNYVEAVTVDPRFWISLRVTFTYTLFSVPLGIMGSLGLALLLNVKVRGIPLFRTMYYLPSLSSAVAAILIWRKLFQPEGGLINTLIYGADGKGNFLGLAKLLEPLATNGQVNWLGNENTSLAALVIMSLWGIGGGMVILLAGLQGIPEYYYEAAKLDGANAWQRFKAVTVPLLTPALFFSLVTGCIGSFQVFTQSLVMTNGGPGDSTRFYMLHLYGQAFQSLKMGYASALAWILFWIIMAFTFFQFRLSKWVYSEGSDQ